MFRPSHIQPAPQLPPEPHWRLCTQIFERVSQKPFAQSLSWLHVGAPDVPPTQVERESQTCPVGQVVLFWHMLVFLQVPLSQSEPGEQSQSERHCDPPGPTFEQPLLSQV